MSTLSVNLISDSNVEGNDAEILTRRNFFERKFWDNPREKIVENILEVLFKLKYNKVTAREEIYYGFVQFISCLYVLPVIPYQLLPAGYDETRTVVVTAAVCGIGSMIAGFFDNLPFVIAPPTSISIYFAVYLQQNSMSPDKGSTAVVWSGLVLMLIGYRPLGQFLAKLIPGCIQAGCAIGIGLITALAGATEVNLVETGKYTILQVGKIDSEAIITLAGVALASIAVHYDIKGAFCVTLIFNTFVWWTLEKEWPSVIAASPKTEKLKVFTNPFDEDTFVLIASLVFLYILTLNGLVSSLSDLGRLARKDGTTPRSRWLYIMCGMVTVISGALSGPPILISPESAGGIKAGAKTGLSTVVCGLLFCFSTFFAPFFKCVPPCATAPLLIMVGVLLFQNCRKVDWKVISEAVPSYCVLFFIPFTYSLLHGICIGYVMYFVIKICTGELWEEVQEKLNISRSRNSNSINNINGDRLSQPSTADGSKPHGISLPQQLWSLGEYFFHESQANIFKLNFGYYDASKASGPLMGNEVPDSAHENT